MSTRKLQLDFDAHGVASIINLRAPTQAGDAASKAYVDAVVSGLDWKPSARVAATANVNVASAPAAIDGVTLTANDRVLLPFQTAGAENGLYVFNGAGSALTRAPDADSSAEVTAGLSIIVEEGTQNGDTWWVLTTDGPITLGTTALTFSSIGTVVNAGTGLQKSGNTISLVIPVAVASGGTGSTTASGARAALGVPGKYEQDFGDGSAVSFSINHALGSIYVDVSVYLKSTGAEEEVGVTVVDANHVVLDGWAAAPALNSYHVVVFG